MTQPRHVVDATKRALRERGITYADVAKALDLSEASVKRLFSRGTLSLDRLAAIAELMGMDLADLVRLAETVDPATRRLTYEQEKYLVERPKLLAMFFWLLNDLDLDTIIEYFQVERPEGILLLRDLEHLGLIERRPFDRVRLKVSRQLAWRRDGPIRRFIDERVLREFLGGDFHDHGEAYDFVSGLMSTDSRDRLQREIDRLVRTFNELVEQDTDVPPDRRAGTSLLIAMRPWKFSLFNEGNP